MAVQEPTTQLHAFLHTHTHTHSNTQVLPYTMTLPPQTYQGGICIRVAPSRQALSTHVHPRGLQLVGRRGTSQGPSIETWLSTWAGW